MEAPARLPARRDPSGLGPPANRDQPRSRHNVNNENWHFIGAAKGTTHRFKKGPVPEPLMMHPRWGGFSVPIAIVMCRRQGGPHLYFRAPMPSLCHSRPRVAREFGHVFTFSGAMQKDVGRVHRLAFERVSDFYTTTASPRSFMKSKLGHCQIQTRPKQAGTQLGRALLVIGQDMDRLFGLAGDALKGARLHSVLLCLLTENIGHGLPALGASRNRERAFIDRFRHPGNRITTLARNRKFLRLHPKRQDALQLPLMSDFPTDPIPVKRKQSDPPQASLFDPRNDEAAS
jgi:hypothetical protein